MATGVITPIPVLLNNFNFDSTSSLEHPTKQGISSGFLIGELIDTNTTNKRKGYKSLPSKPKVKEFTASRRNSLGKSNYYRLSVQPKPKKKGKYNSGFQNAKEIEQVFNINPQKTTNLPEYPSYMVEYFVKKMELLKKNPDLQYQILKAKIDVPKVAQVVEEERVKRKHVSMPIPNLHADVQKKAEELQKLNRKSTPANIKFHYQPIEMSMDEYLKTPLDLYKHRRKQKSVGSENTLNTKTTSSGSNAYTHGSTRSAMSSIDTTDLSQINRLGSERILKTSRMEHVLKKRSVQFESSVIPEEKLEVSFEKFGVSPKPHASKHKSVEINPTGELKRLSNHADISIESGGEAFGKFKLDIFNQKFVNSDELKAYIKREYPDYYNNEYMMTRLIIEIYTRRIIAGRIALKLGTDKGKRSSLDTEDIWLGLKEIITSVYGEDQGRIFQSQRFTN